MTCKLLMLVMESFLAENKFYLIRGLLQISLLI